MTQFKDRAAGAGPNGQESVSVGLFDYPVLMAADILLYDTDEVPVGDDQRQHVELTRDIVLRFNHQFGAVFTVPKATFPPVGARIMDLQAPARKMSKSQESPQGTIEVLDDAKQITKKIKSAVTDSGTDVRHDRDAKPGVSNLIEIHAAVTGQTIASVERQFDVGGYGQFKSAVAEAVVEYLRPVQTRYAELIADPGEVDRLLAAGADAARGPPTRSSHARRRQPDCFRAQRWSCLEPLGALRRELPGRRMCQVRWASLGEVELAEVFAVEQQPADGPVGARCLEHHCLGVAPDEAHPDPEAGVRVLLDRGLRHVGIVALRCIELIEVGRGLAETGTDADVVDRAAGSVDPVADTCLGPAGSRIRPAEPADQRDQDEADRTDPQSPAAPAGRWSEVGLRRIAPMALTGLRRMTRRGGGSSRRTK